MTSKVRIDAVALETTEGLVAYQFPSSLTVLAGPTGVGKTTLLELIKYGLGCDALLAPVAREHVNDVVLDITIESSRLTLRRSLDRKKGQKVRVTDRATRERLPDQNVSAAEPSLSALLMNALGLSPDMRAATRSSGSTNPGNRITFADLFTFMYVAQSDINRDIAHSLESYREPKRKIVFELLFALTSAGILRLRSELAELNRQVEQIAAQHATVLEFLRDSGTTSRAEALQAITAAAAEERAAEAALAELRDATDPVTDRETLTIRDLLTGAESSLAEARRALVGLSRQQADCARERRRVQADLDRYHRMLDAGERLANIEFTVCPRCMQPLTQRRVPDNACRVCLQPDPVPPGHAGSDPYEARQLTGQLAEMDDQVEAIATQVAAVTQAVADREQLVKSLSAELDARTRERITPRLQAFSDAMQKQATARARQQQLDQVLRQWDRADDIGAAVKKLRAEREEKRAEADRAEENLRARKDEVIAELSGEFQSTVIALGIPGVETATIHPTNYLPLLNGEPYQTFSKGGGIITAVQVAYWISLLAVALRRRDTYYPTLLIIDTPQLALNSQEQITVPLYQRLVNQADASRGQVQFIIADNQLPIDYKRGYAQKDFGYDHPTVSTIPHPGPAAVQPINRE